MVLCQRLARDGNLQGSLATSVKRRKFALFSVNVWQETETCMVLWQRLSREGSFQGSGISHATTAPKPSIRSSWRADDAVVGRGSADGQRQRVDIPDYARTANSASCRKKKKKKKLEEYPYGIICHVSTTTQSVEELDLGGESHRGRPFVFIALLFVLKCRGR